jgi:16S rRNA (cytidine1402-2'-O)-methyltransferase
VGTANVRGEVTLVVAGADPAPVDPQELVRQVDELVATGVRLKDATRQVAARSGASAREIYAAVVSQR